MYIIKYFTKIIAFTLLASQAAFSFWATGHQLIAEIAQNNLSEKSQLQINQLLNTKPSVPILSDRYQQPEPSIDNLYQEFNYIQAAATWPDDIKNYYWQDKSLKYRYSDLHFVDPDIDVTHQGEANYCQNHLTKEYLNEVTDKVPLNLINGIKSSINTLVSNTTSINEKSTALRFLIHLMGDLGQPLHVFNLTFNDHSSYGGNYVIFEENKKPTYQQIIGENPYFDTQVLSFSNLHAYFDGMIGQYNQLQENMNTKYSPHGYELWQDYQVSYLNYLTDLASQVGIFQDTQAPSITNWALETSKLACDILVTNTDVITYKTDENSRYLTILFNSQIFRQTYAEDFNQQAYFSGLRLHYLLEAIFNPNSQNEITQSYLNFIILPIKHDDSIKTLSQLTS
ncbi:S1/P1 nuclease [Thiotrichales bacterium 19S9-12]|nr:S1/P1 nuclease [Thiotrichales bacterium 19S9-11]MCF6811134.1 S1/P1 nuclease [Thiotrichales bacterium 19S9-12]